MSQTLDEHQYKNLSTDINKLRLELKKLCISKELIDKLKKEDNKARVEKSKDKYRFTDEECQSLISNYISFVDLDDFKIFKLKKWNCDYNVSNYLFDKGFVKEIENVNSILNKAFEDIKNIFTPYIQEPLKQKSKKDSRIIPDKLQFEKWNVFDNSNDSDDSDDSDV